MDYLALVEITIGYFIGYLFDKRIEQILKEKEWTMQFYVEI